jgi:hypothetical protein
LPLYAAFWNDFGRQILQGFWISLGWMARLTRQTIGPLTFTMETMKPFSNPPIFSNATLSRILPGGLGDFYRVLFHRFPGSKFVLLTRPPDDWFKSMLSHSDGNVTGLNKGHCRVFRREKDFYDLIDLQMIECLKDPPLSELKAFKERKMHLWDKPHHYKCIYEIHNRGILEFFRENDPSRLFTTALYDPMKWVNLGKFLGLEFHGITSVMKTEVANFHESGLYQSALFFPIHRILSNAVSRGYICSF